MMTKAFLKDLAERALATAVETAIPLVVAVETIDMLDYKHAGLVVLSATALSVLKGLAAKLSKGDDSASLAK